jgi:glycosyltransferase involved in cell wall biosynthesis
MPKLCVNLAFLPDRPTGLGNYALNLLPHIPTEGITLLSAHQIPGYTCHLVPEHLSSEHGRWGNLKRLLWSQTQLPGIYRHLKSDLLFSPIPEAPLASHCRFVVTVHDLIPLRFPGPFPSLLTTYFRFFVPEVLRRAEHILCDSQSTAQDIIQFYQISEKKITAIPLAYDAKHFYPRNIKTSSYFLYLGRQDSYKNLERMIDAFGLLANEYEFWIAGPEDSKQTPILKAQVARLKLGKRIRFLDYVPFSELPSLIEGAIALMFPTLWEGFGLPVLEGMACGTPVITSALSSIPEVAGDAALFVDPYCTPAIAEAMTAIAETPSLRLQLRERGLAQVKKFSWEKTGQETARVLVRYL